jgi:dTDP-glucose pyrophosphorylase
MCESEKKEIKEVCWKDMMILTDSSVKEAMKIMEKYAHGIALVIDINGILKGTVTDGDIRRLILRGGSLDDKVNQVMNKDFTFVTPGYTDKLIKSIFEQKAIYQIPVLDDEMRIVDVIFQKYFFKVKKKTHYVVIMAGGLGTRLLPLTKETPKPMLRVGARPLLEIIIEQLKSYGYTKIILCLNHKSEVIQNYFQDGSNFGVDITYINERKKLGTVGAIKLMGKYLNETFFLINGDILTRLNFEQFMNFHIERNHKITVATRKYQLDIPFGVINLKDNIITKLEEKPCMNFFINGGIYCLEPETINYIPENKSFDITQLINTYLIKEERVGSFPITEYWMDIGQIEDYNKANTDYESIFRDIEDM